MKPKTESQLQAESLNAIFADGNHSDLDRVMAAYDHITTIIINQADKDIELNRALGDQQAVIREQIKQSTIKHTRSILNQCCMRVTGKEVFNDAK